MEDFVKIIPILVLLFVYLAPHLFRKRGGGREEDGEEAPPPAPGREQSVDPAEEALRRIEAMLRGEKPREAQPAPPPARTAEGGGEVEASRHDRPVTEGAPTPPKPRTVIRNRVPVQARRVERAEVEVKPDDPAGKPAAAQPAAAKAPPVAVPAPRPGRGRPGRAELRRHVWWSEVLGPCRGLRG